MALAIVAVTLTSALAVAGLVWEVNRREEAFCEAITDNRKGLEDLIDVVLQEGPSGDVNLDALPEFQAVDPEVQALVRVLVNPPDTDEPDDPPDIIERLRTYQASLDVVEGCSA
jgi:hypothetical protein